MSAQISGTYLTRELFPHLGIADEIGPKIRRAENELVGHVLARGEAEIGFQQISELLGVTGVDYVGPLPSEVQRVSVMSAAITKNARNPEAARALIRFLESPEAKAAIKSTGLEPITAP